MRYNGTQFVNVAMTIGDISTLQAALDGKAAASHTHAIAGVTGLQAALDAKAASAHTHTVADVTGLTTTLTGKQDVSAKGQANGFAGLGSDARVPIGQLPANVVTTDYRSTPELFTGDLTVVQTDNNKLKRCIATVDRTVTLPALLVGTTVRFFQSAAGRITFAAGSGVILQSVSNFTRTSGLNADATATVLGHQHLAHLRLARRLMPILTLQQGFAPGRGTAQPPAPAVPVVVAQSFDVANFSGHGFRAHQIQVSGGAVGGVLPPFYVVGGTDAEFFEVDDEGVVTIKFFASLTAKSFYGFTVAAKNAAGTGPAAALTPALFAPAALPL